MERGSFNGDFPAKLEGIFNDGGEGADAQADLEDTGAGVGGSGFSNRFNNAGRDGEFVHENSILRFVRFGLYGRELSLGPGRLAEDAKGAAFTIEECKQTRIRRLFWPKTW